MHREDELIDDLGCTHARSGDDRLDWGLGATTTATATTPRRRGSRDSGGLGRGRGGGGGVGGGGGGSGSGCGLGGSGGTGYGCQTGPCHSGQLTGDVLGPPVELVDAAVIFIGFIPVIGGVVATADAVATVALVSITKQPAEMVKETSSKLAHATLNEHLRGSGAAEQIAQRIVAWRDEDPLDRVEHKRMDAKRGAAIKSEAEQWCREY